MGVTLTVRGDWNFKSASLSTLFLQVGNEIEQVWERDLADGVVRATRTGFRVEYDGGRFFELTGKGFAYRGDWFPTSGTITGWSEGKSAADAHTLTGLSLGVATLRKATLVESMSGGNYQGAGLYDRQFAGADRLVGGEVADTLYGYGRNDVIHGRGGYDLIDGGAGDDRLFGGAGRDLIYGGAGADIIRGGAGDDGGGPGAMLTNAGLYGGGGNDVIHGEAGADRLFGGAGVDQLFGGAGRDRLEGGGQRDFLTGGAGADTLVFSVPGDSLSLAYGRDRITDFSSAQRDRIDLQWLTQGILVDGAPAALEFIGNAGFSRQIGEIRQRIVGQLTLLEIDLDGDGRADFGIELLGRPVLGAGDFIL